VLARLYATDVLQMRKKFMVMRPAHILKRLLAHLLSKGTIESTFESAFENVMQENSLLMRQTHILMK
jgi:hypothetical protein